MLPSNRVSKIGPAGAVLFATQDTAVYNISFVGGPFLSSLHWYMRGLRINKHQIMAQTLV